MTNDMVNTPFRIGFLLFPNITQPDLTGPTWSRVSLRNHPRSVITILLAATYSTPGYHTLSRRMGTENSANPFRTCLPEK
jgi:hypothetical protein